MILTPVDSIPGLYLVDDAYDESMIDEFLLEDLSLLPHTTLADQENWPERKTYNILPKHSKWHPLKRSVNIGPIRNLGFDPIATVLWADQPGFAVKVHADYDSVEALLQIYLTDIGNQCTVYHDEFGNTFEVPYKKNSGYFLINKKQMHEVPTTTAYRLSALTWFKRV